MRGRLKNNLDYWRQIGTSSMILKVLSDGYHLPFVSEPPKVMFKNHLSALAHCDFVENAIVELLQAGSIEEVRKDLITVCSPLGVVPKKNNKFRLILDLRF